MPRRRMALQPALIARHQIQLQFIRGRKNFARRRIRRESRISGELRLMSVAFEHSAAAGVNSSTKQPSHRAE